MDSLTIAALVDECNLRLQGARISKIFQLSADELEFKLWTGSENLRLYLLCRPQRACFHLTEQNFPHPFTPPRFCQLLRARLTRVLSFEQVRADRLVLIKFSGKNDKRYQLLVDLRPKPNLVLLDMDGKIIDLLLRGGAGERPGDYYVWPEQNRLPLTGEVLPQVPADCVDPGSFRSWLLGQVAPMAKLVADDLAECVRQGASPEEVLARYVHDLEEGKLTPRVCTCNGQMVLAVLPLYGLNHVVLAEFATVSQALEAGDVVASVEGPTPELVKILSKSLNKLHKRLAQIETDYAGLEDLDSLQHTGNLLLSNLYRVQRGMTEVSVEDYAADPPVPIIIPLDPRLTPQENAERLFKKARKRRRGEEHYLRRQQETQEEIEWLEAMALAIEETDDAIELDALKKQLADAGYLKLREEPLRRQVKTGSSALLEAVSPNGFKLTWGRNPRQNDRVSREVAAADDLWFHAHNLPGCHLVLKCGGKGSEVPEEDVLFAASLAAGYSKGKASSKVEVMVARGRDVKKQKGARHGLVTVETYRTVMVAPARLED
mgnify:FL=1